MANSGQLKRPPGAQGLLVPPPLLGRGKGEGVSEWMLSAELPGPLPLLGLYLQGGLRPSILQPLVQFPSLQHQMRGTYPALLGDLWEDKREQ